MDAGLNTTTEAIKSSLQLPTTAKVKRSGSYREKLPPLSPRSMKLFASGGSDVEVRNPGSNYDETTSNSSSSTDSGCNLITQQQDANDDIEFFVQVVGVFRQYVDDQILLLEKKLQQTQSNFQNFQQLIKSNEETFREDEAQLTVDISKLTALLFQRQNVLKTSLQNHHQDVITNTRNDMDVCRKLLKCVSGTLAFAKNLRDNSGENMRENAIKELKTRLKEVKKLEAKTMTSKLDGTHQRCVVENIQASIKNLNFHRPATSVDFSTCKSLMIQAPRQSSDITKDSVLVRWIPLTATSCLQSLPKYQLEWSYNSSSDDAVTNTKKCEECSAVISELPPACDVIVRVRCINESSDQSSEWSEPAFFTTLPGARKFIFDQSTAHAKLKLSNAGKTVFYGGDHQSKNPTNPQSSTRFTFALNVLGDVAFYSGRHYFEVEVNEEGWAVGVAYKTIARNSWLGSNSSSWILHFNGAKYQYKIRHAGESTDVTPAMKPLQRRHGENYLLDRVAIFIDYEAGIVKFIDPSNEQVLHTCNTSQSGGFTECLCAAVNPFYHGGKLTIISGLDVPSYLQTIPVVKN